ncbi:hypothetical protein [Bacillus sp. REN16]|uniref:hypothetical protein n=1 Tax=Bacillus sp. REN16 TaxID=2887296 RepID=UPI001E4E4293|nr:hypothetical protein [Bacillus sp. REN16]MCC3358502.1 hypothetical protein [Bacillus sp. REN16]
MKMQIADRRSKYQNEDANRGSKKQISQLRSKSLIEEANIKMKKQIPDRRSKYQNEDANPRSKKQISK